MEGGWRLLRFANAPAEFNPANTFLNGQCFNWTQVESGFVAVFQGSLLEVRSDRDGLAYRAEPGIEEQAIRDYLQLDVSMRDLFAQWVQADPSLASSARDMAGMRVLRQDPWECTISFLCSQNNHIRRITQILQKLRAKFGKLVCKKYERDWFAFPTPEELATASVADLKEVGLGYRAEYMFGTCKSVIAKGGRDWLLSLRSDPTAASQLRLLSGIGPKVADCITLFSLDGKSTVPIDVHMWRIAKEKFQRELKSCKTLTDTTYEKIGRLFQGKYGDYAGWAHSLLYAASILQPVEKRKRSPPPPTDKRSKLPPSS